MQNTHGIRFSFSGEGSHEQPCRRQLVLVYIQSIVCGGSRIRFPMATTAAWVVCAETDPKQQQQQHVLLLLLLLLFFPQWQQQQQQHGQPTFETQNCAKPYSCVCTHGWLERERGVFLFVCGERTRNRVVVVVVASPNKKKGIE